jgi:formylglycine-generating enzyme required for sulfatase activity
MNADGTGTRQLCFDQEHNWCPTVMPDGRILYARWEYTDTPHYFTRLLFRMNPDGTGQSEFYGSNSPWPNSIFYARPIPGQPTKFVAVISGHHGVPRMGELILFDIALGRHQAAGAIQRIPGHGKPVVPVIGDAIVNDSWPKFLHPWPLTDRHFIVSMQPDAKSSWGLYLVDVFDNLVLLKEEPGYALMEPIPLRPTATPPVIPDRVDLRQKEATVYMNDVYFGQGLANVPRGSVKQLRLFAYHYAYPRMGGHIEIGIDGPWDVHRILGTVPVEADGSASFKVPANTPIAVQPLDADGRAVQVMRSWFTAMPGEKVSCIGCHESQNATAAALQPLAFNRTPSDITPWRGPARGFSFKREVQPVLERHCVRCHDGSQVGQPDFSLAHKSEFRHFTPSYVQLHRYVRRPGPESDYFLQKPLEFHASTSELIQMLEKGHHGVRLEAEAWDRLTTWIDLNVPDHGTWSENRAIASNYRERRQTMKTEYAQADEDPETIIATTPFAGAPALVVTPPAPAAAPAPVVPGWPFDAAQARQRQADSSLPARLSIKLANDTPLELVLIPAGEFVMGEAEGSADEQPLSRVRVEKPFYLARCETMNAQYAAFDPTHDSAFISVFNKDISKRGETANRATQPVLRVNWQQAMAYCAWLTKETGRQFTLPTEAQWEYACRAGTATPLSYGALNTDFSRLANLADSRLESLCRGNSPKWLPAITNVNDGATVSDNTGRYPANAWGLLDMHGNVAEWTRSAYAPYPYHENDGRNEINSTQRRVVRGGSFYDRPSRARSGFRLAYSPWQAVFNVGFRVTCEVSEKPTVQARAR